MNLSVREITTEEFASLEQQIRASHVGITALQETWQSLDDYFNKSSVLDDEKFKWTYFRIYTELTWKMFGSQSRDFIVDVAIKRQIPMALQLGFDVFKQVISYLGLRTFDRADMQSLYLKIKKSFQESNVIVGKWNGSDVTVAELIKEIDFISKRHDSLEQAEFESKLKQMMFPNDLLVNKYFTDNSDEAVTRFVNLVVFFDIVSETDIWRVVDSFLNPEKYQNVTPGEVPASPTPTPQTTPTPQPVVLTKPVPAQSAAVEPQVPLSTEQIKSQIESQFKKDADGNFVDIEGVMAKLGELAEKNNDPKIAEMVYFDETENKFKWNI